MSGAYCEILTYISIKVAELNKHLFKCLQDLRFDADIQNVKN